jgi:hypothetical protein
MCHNDWQIQFRRMLSPEAQTEWGELQDFLQNISHTHEDDVISWGLTTSKRFCTNSLYKFMTSGGVLAVALQKEFGSAKYL